MPLPPMWETHQPAAYPAVPMLPPERDERPLVLPPTTPKPRPGPDQAGRD